MGLVIIAFYISFSVTAGVYNEWVYKGIEAEQSIHLQNVSMYVWGIFFNTMKSLLYREGEGSSLSVGMFAGFNIWTWLLVCTYSFKGLIVSQVMKYLNNIVKLFMSAA